MAVRQYIGARYVPKFDGEWSASKIYEPLTVVGYQNGSYTSKKSVPAGIVPTDTEYWVLTGNYNGQIDELIAQFGELQDAYDDVIAEQNRSNLFPYSNIILMGDSWGITNANFTGWIPQFVAQLPTYVEHHELAISGGGFTKTGDLNYLSRFQALSNGIANKENVDLVFIQGFDNDTDASTIYNAVTAFCDYAIATYPNAHIVIANASQNLLHTYNENVAKFAAEANIAGYKGKVAFANFGGCWDPRARHDVAHLNTMGYTQLMRNIYNYLLSGHIEGWYGASALSLSGMSGAVFFIGCGNMIDVTIPAITTPYAASVTAGGEVNITVPLDTTMDSSTPDLGTCSVCCTIGGTKYVSTGKVSISNMDLLFRIFIPATGAMTEMAVQTNRYRVPRNYF